MNSKKKKVLIVLPAGEKYRITSDKNIVPKRNLLRFSVLPLLLVASLTPSEYEVDICDENVEILNFDSDAQIIGISFMTALAPRAFEISRKFREKGKIVIAGGYFPTLCPELAIEHFDSVIVGDAENLWQKAIRDIEAGNLQQIYRHSKYSEVLQIPIPRRDLILKTSKYYATINAFQIGRGCLHKCKFCSITAFYNGLYSVRPIEDVINELKGISRNLIFVDDNIISDPIYTRELFKKMIPLKKRWVGQCSLKIADDPESLRLARESGCLGLFVGVENINVKNLNAVNKNFNTDFSMVERIKKIRKAKIGIIAGLIVGMDEDDVTIFQKTLKFLRKTGIDAIQVNIMTPLPGTPLYSEYSLAKRIIDFDFSHYDFRHVVISPSKMTCGNLQNGADWLYSRFYRLDNIIMRGLISIWYLGIYKTILAFKLNLTYRYDNKREHIVGNNPAK